MRQEYLTVKSIAGPLFIVEKTRDVAYEEIASDVVPTEKRRLGKLLEVT